MSLLISLTHYWDGDEIKTDVNVYLSKDNHHDTHYFQSAFEEHAKKYEKYLSEDGVHYINSGASLMLTLTLTLTLTITLRNRTQTLTLILIQTQMVHLPTSKTVSHWLFY